MPIYPCNGRKSPRHRQDILPAPAPVWLPTLTDRCPPCFDCPPGETSRVPRGKLANMSEVTQILAAIEQGDPHAAEQLLPLVYDELRKLAAQKLAQEKPGQTLQATALVHEAYLRLVDTEQVRRWNSRGHFFAAAAEAMRRILVDQARRRQAAKRGGQHGRDELHESSIAAPGDVEETLAINDILDHFATIDPVAADLVKLRFFVGLTMEDAGQALNISVRSAYDAWAYARAWLHGHLPSD